VISFIVIFSKEVTVSIYVRSKDFNDFIKFQNTCIIIHCMHGQTKKLFHITVDISASINERNLLTDKDLNYLIAIAMYVLA